MVLRALLAVFALGMGAWVLRDVSHGLSGPAFACGPDPARPGRTICRKVDLPPPPLLILARATGAIAGACLWARLRMPNV